jgi:hypothetical protein
MMTVVFSCMALHGLLSAPSADAANQNGDIARFILRMPPGEGSRIGGFQPFAARLPEEPGTAYRKPGRFCPPLFRSNTSPQCKGRILLVGDSLMQGLGPSMQALFRKRGISVVSAAKPATGLTNRQFYSWEQHLPVLIEQHKPDTVLFLLGANDIQGMRAGGRTVVFGTRPWIQEYQARIANLLELAGDARVFWVGLPRMRSAGYDKNVRMLNALFQETVAHFGGTYVSTEEVFGSRGEPYSPYVYKDGKRVLVRAGDGIHMTMKGYEMITETVARRLMLRDAGE